MKKYYLLIGLFFLSVAMGAQSTYDLAVKAKHSIIQGDINKAKNYLRQMVPSKYTGHLVKNYYLAMTEFFQNNYTESLRLLNQSMFKGQEYYPAICHLKLLNLIALQNKRKIIGTFNRCYIGTKEYSKQDQRFIGDLAQIAANKNKEVFIPYLKLSFYKDSIPEVESWIKLVLALNFEDKVLNDLADIPSKFLEEESLQELLGLLYFKTGDNKKALELLSDLTGPNAENIKGLIAVLNDDHEVAYGHFSLALKNKVDSINALKYAIPLAWKLGKSSDGIEFIERYYNLLNEKDQLDDISKVNLIILKAAFLSNSNRPYLAYKILTSLRKKYRNLLPREYTLIKIYNSIVLGDLDNALSLSSKLCDKRVLTSCWLNFQLGHWENFTKVTQRNDELPFFPRLTSEAFLNETYSTLKDPPLVDQSDIDELDIKTANK